MSNRLLYIFYCLTIIGYLLLNDLTAFEIGPITMTSGDIFFTLLCITLSWDMVYNTIQFPIWKRGINFALIFYLLLPTLSTITGFILFNSSVSVFTSTIRFIQMALLFPITAALIQKQIIGVKNIYHILILVSVIHFIFAVDRMFGHGDTILFFEAEKILKSSTFTTAETRSAGLFGEVVWYGLLNGIMLIYGVIGTCMKEICIKNSIILSITSLLGIAISISRTGAIMAIPAIIFVLLIRIKQSDSMFVLYAMSIMGILIIVGTTITGGFTRFYELRFLLTGDFSKISSLNARFLAWREAIKIYSYEGLLGTLIPLGATDYSITIDNYYITALVQRGIPGILSVLLLHLILGLTTLYEYFHSNQPLISILGFSVTIGISLGSLMFSLRGFIPVIALFWVTIGIMYGRFGSQQIVFAGRYSNGTKSC